MFWFFIGVLPILVAGTAVFFAAARFRVEAGQGRPTHPVLLALLAGVLWPVLLLGLTELALVMAMPPALRRRRLRRHPGVAADTTALAQR